MIVNSNGVKDRTYVKTQREPPKEKPPPKVELGSYCVVVKQYLEKNNEGGLLAEFEGRSTDWDIIQLTKEKCSMIKNGKFRTGKCGDPFVKIEKFDDRCNGVVRVTEIK